MTHKTPTRIQKGIEAVQAEEYLTGLTLLAEGYSGGRNIERAADGLSYYGLCLALVEKKYKAAIEFCKLAIEKQFYNPVHYLNLAKVYVASGHRKKAVEAVSAGLKPHPEDEALLAYRKELGVRVRPTVPFLPREHPINLTLGRARSSKGKK